MPINSITCDTVYYKSNCCTKQIEADVDDGYSLGVLFTPIDESSAVTHVPMF